METWTPRPNRKRDDLPLPLLRVRPGKPLTGIITNADIVGAYTHFWRGRTTPCTGPTCDACEAQHAARWYGYACIWNPTNNHQAIAELTPACVPAIDAYLAQFGTLRGAAIELARTNRKTNSRISCSIKPSPYTTDKIPAAFALQAQLERMWEMYPNTNAAKIANGLTGRLQWSAPNSNNGK